MDKNIQDSLIVPKSPIKIDSSDLINNYFLSFQITLITFETKDTLFVKSSWVHHKLVKFYLKTCLIITILKL